MQKEITIFDYLPKVLPILDVLFIIWVAFNSPDPWLTTPIHIGMPIAGFSTLLLFKKSGRFGFYMIGICTCIPQFFLNCWASETCPTWLTEFSFIAGGLLLTKSFGDRITVLAFVLLSTIIPMLIGHNHTRFITTIVIAEIAVWFLMERSVKFMDIQKEQITKQKHIVEEKQKEILDSIHYAQRIQKSLMPTEKHIQKQINRLRRK